MSSLRFAGKSLEDCIALVKERLKLVKEPEILENGACKECRTSWRMCEYHSLTSLLHDFERSLAVREVLRNAPRNGMLFCHIPHNGCDLNHNEDKGETP